jgi:hypothetical protein
MNNFKINTKLTQKQAIEAFPIYSHHWWNRKRFDGTGPKFRKIGNRVYYELSDLIDFFEAPSLVKSTSELKKGENNNDD